MSIKGSAIPRVDRAKVFELLGERNGEVVADEILCLVREAVAMPIVWGDMTLEQGVNDILARFHAIHPELSPESLHEIGRCVGWQLR